MLSRRLMTSIIVTAATTVSSFRSGAVIAARYYSSNSGHPFGCLCCANNPSSASSSSSSGSNPFRQSNHSFATTTRQPPQQQQPGGVHIQKLLENNRKWVEESKAANPNFMDGFKSPQQPKYLYFGCSDSRVPPNQLLGLGPGELFVHRNVGNLIPGNDLNVLSVLEFAVGYLNVTDIIVTGHYDCGAVRASTSRQDLGTLENWLRLIRDVQRLHREQLDYILDNEQKHRTLVELNVIEQCLNIFKVGVVQRKRNQVRQKLVESGITDPAEIASQLFPRIHGMVFDPATGLVKSLPVDFDKRIGSLDSIYGLYQEH